MKRFDGTVVCIGTGPSLRLEQIQAARSRGFKLLGCNRVFQDVPDLELVWGTNLQFWEYYWPRGLREYPSDKWTPNKEAADRFILNRIAERNAPGLSEDPSVIHHGHGGGYSMLNLAYLMGATRIVLLGYDLRYAPDYNGAAHEIGSAPRHYFGEYDASLQHWPSKRVKAGVHEELVGLYEGVAKQGLVEIVNCTGPNSALTCFEVADINAL